MSSEVGEPKNETRSSTDKEEERNFEVVKRIFNDTFSKPAETWPPAARGFVRLLAKGELRYREAKRQGVVLPGDLKGG